MRRGNICSPFMYLCLIKNLQKLVFDHFYRVVKAKKNWSRWLKKSIPWWSWKTSICWSSSRCDEKWYNRERLIRVWKILTTVNERRLHIYKLHFIDAFTVDKEWLNNKNKCVHYINERECNQLTLIIENKVRNARSSYLTMVDCNRNIVLFNIET